MREAVTLRAARTTDAEPCARLVNAWIDETPWVPRVHPPEEILRRCRERVIPDRSVAVAEIGGAVAGFIAVDRQTAEVTSLFVGLRGRGIGAALIAWAKEQCDELTLWTFQANTGARRFYAREGFAEGERSRGENEECLPDVEYVWARG